MNVIEETPRLEVCHLDDAPYARIHGEGDVWRADLGTLGEVGLTIRRKLASEHPELWPRLDRLRGDIRHVWPVFAESIVSGLGRMVDNFDDLNGLRRTLLRSLSHAEAITEPEWRLFRTDAVTFWTEHQERLEDDEQFRSKVVALGNTIRAAGSASMAMSDVAWAMYARYPHRARAFSGAVVNAIEAWASWGAQGDVGELAKSSRAGARAHAAAIYARKLLELTEGR